MEDKLQNSISTNTLYKEYQWYENTVPALVQEAFDGFFEENFRIMLVGVSQNINCMTDKESCFVTKIRINQEYDMFFRTTEKSLDIILNLVLGQSKSKFNINKISDLEAKVITSFNDFMFEKIKTILKDADATELKRTNFDVIHLTFILKEKNEQNNKAGKFIITLPKVLLSPEAIASETSKFSENDFPNSETYVKVQIGKTKFSLYDIKNLETDDVVVFENSSINNITLSLNGTDIPAKINPNMDILIPDYDDGGNNMADSHQNLWDSIEVEMSAEFDAVKITLGELKDIEEGLVVDITSLYDNNVTLKVENKTIASGQLVIVNDRYGVKINNVVTDNNSATVRPAQNQEIPSEETETSFEPTEQANELPQEDSSGDEEFDYSDFELEDDNI
ncbi:MAG: FliM/FliN family flagellar motor switch protein [Candidatus Gastranaerophilaceae bacterium]